MSVLWLRLWHDMPNDPKWRTVARISGQPISLVISVYLHLLVDASRNVTRGHVAVTHEDLASALDVTEDAIGAVFEAMQGRVLDGLSVSGWDKRQPKKEEQASCDGFAKTPAERKRAQRTRDENALDSVVEIGFCDTPEEFESRNVTPCHVAVTTDTDTDKSIKGVSIDTPTSAEASPPPPPCPHVRLIELFGQTLPELPQPKPELWAGKAADSMRARWRWLLTARRKNGMRYAETTEDGVAWMARFFGYVGKSDFLMGRSGSFQATLQWLMKAENFAKVIQGNYDNREAA